MEIVRIVSIGIIVTVLAISLKKSTPEFSLMLSIAGSVMIFFLIMPELSTVIDMVNRLAARVDTNMEYIGIILKVVGIAYISEFGSQLCLDAGESAVSSKIELAGKALIMVVSAPILFSLADLIMNTLP